MTLHIECHYHPMYDLFEVKVSNLIDFETLWHDWTTLPTMIEKFRGDTDVLEFNNVQISIDKLSRLRAAEYLEFKIVETSEKQKKQPRR